MVSIQSVIERIMQEIPGAPLTDTVDTFKSGDPAQQVTGIVTTFLATTDLIQKAVDVGANLIITHEPTFYNHRDQVDWLEANPVYQHKRALIEANDLVIWRFHDYWHTHRPDGIYVGMLRELGWEGYADKDDLHLLRFPPMTVGALITQIKERLNLPMVRVVGDMDRSVERVGFAVGAIGSRFHINTLADHDLDVLICGEAPEWETPEYVRDANSAGKQQTLIIIGHEPSEEAGMAYLVDWLRERLPADVPIQHIPSGNPFKVM